MTDAKDIYQDMLDALSHAMWSGDDAAVLARLALPNQIGNLDAMQTIETPDRMLETIRAFRQGLLRMGVCDYYRICNQASFDPKDPDRITGNHTTHVLVGEAQALEPFLNEMTLIRRDGKWLGERNRALVPSTHYSAITSPFSGEAGFEKT